MNSPQGLWVTFLMSSYIFTLIRLLACLKIKVTKINTEYLFYPRRFVNFFLCCRYILTVLARLLRGISYTFISNPLFLIAMDSVWWCFIEMQMSKCLTSRRRNNFFTPRLISFSFLWIVISCLLPMMGTCQMRSKQKIWINYFSATMMSKLI